MKCETTLGSGLKKVKETNRPGMVIIHRSTCSACNKLKRKFLDSKEIDRLSKEFVMISLMDEHEPRDEKWWVDGRYFPRIFFLDTKGHIMHEVTNKESTTRYKYFYNNEKSLVQNMETVLANTVGDKRIQTVSPEQRELELRELVKKRESKQLESEKLEYKGMERKDSERKPSGRKGSDPKGSDWKSSTHRGSERRPTEHKRADSIKSKKSGQGRSESIKSSFKKDHNLP